MSQHARTSLASGLILILLGGYFLLVNFFPNLPTIVPTALTWPWIVIAIGSGLLFIGLIVGSVDMAVPAFVVGGIGGILLYQNTTGNWQSWAYAWTLIPGFVGIGTILEGLLKGKWKEFREGIRLIFISSVMFVIFSAFLGGPSLLGQWWPVLLILLGIYIIINPKVKGISSSTQNEG